MERLHSARMRRLPSGRRHLLALAAEFRAVDTSAADARLDELALPLFGSAGGDLRTAAARSPRCWTPTQASTPTAERRRPVAGRGARGPRRPPARARRDRLPRSAAAPACPCTCSPRRPAGTRGWATASGCGWSTPTMDGSQRRPLEPAAGTARTSSRSRRCSGCRERYERVGDRQRAGRAALLRSRLPLRWLARHRDHARRAELVRAVVVAQLDVRESGGRRASARARRTVWTKIRRRARVRSSRRR